MTVVQRRLLLETERLQTELEDLKGVSLALKEVRLEAPAKRWQEDEFAPPEHIPLPPFLKRRTKEITGVVNRLHGGPVAVADRHQINWTRVARTLKLEAEVDWRRGPSPLIHIEKSSGEGNGTGDVILSKMKRFRSMLGWFTQRTYFEGLGLVVPATEPDLEMKSFVQSQLRVLGHIDEETMLIHERDPYRATFPDWATQVEEEEEEPSLMGPELRCVICIGHGKVRGGRLDACICSLFVLLCHFGVITLGDNTPRVVSSARQARAAGVQPFGLQRAH